MILKQPDERAIARFPFRSGMTYRRSLTVIIKTTGSIKKKKTFVIERKLRICHTIFNWKIIHYEAVKMIYFLLHQFDFGKIETTVSLSSLSLPQNCPDFQI